MPLLEPDPWELILSPRTPANGLDCCWFLAASCFSCFLGLHLVPGSRSSLLREPALTLQTFQLLFVPSFIYTAYQTTNALRRFKSRSAAAGQFLKTEEWNKVVLVPPPSILTSLYYKTAIHKIRWAAKYSFPYSSVLIYFMRRPIYITVVSWKLLMRG